MRFLGVVMNVADLSRSIDFYREVLDFTLLSHEEQLAAMSAPDGDQPQVIVLRALGTSPPAGARHVGLRAFMLDVDSPDRLERIASDLESRRILDSRRDHSEWRAVVGRDPDRTAVVVTWHPGGDQISDGGWQTLDDFLYTIGE